MEHRARRDIKTRYLTDELPAYQSKEWAPCLYGMATVISFDAMLSPPLESTLSTM